MSFSNLTKSQARLRQRGKCAQCVWHGDKEDP